MVHALARFLRGSWLRQGVWTVLDQALFAGANFLVNVLLARWLPPEAYGAFTVAFMVFLLAGTVHGGLFVEPMLVFGSGRFEGKTGAYLRVLLGGHAVFALAAGAALAAAGGVAWAFGGTDLAVQLLTLALVQGAILALWMLRRACFVVSRPDWAAAAGALYLVLLAGGAIALNGAGLLTGAVAFGLMGGASLVAAVALALRLGVAGAPPVDGLAADVRAAHVEYGRWSASTGVIEWAQQAAPFLALPFFVGLEGSGTLRALSNLAMPALQGFAALATLCLPVFVRARAEGTFGATTGRIGAALVATAVVYGALVVAFGGPAVTWLYDGVYTATPAMLVCLGLLPVGATVSYWLTTVVRSAERPSAVFRARAAAVSVSATVVVGLSALFGVVGALLGEVVAMLTEVGVLVRPVRAVRAEAAREAPAVAAAAGQGDGAAPRARLRVLLCAFGCRPGCGSEPGIGWHTARELARHHDVTVLTYEGNRRPIEAELAARPVAHLTVAYYALPFEPERFRVHGEPMADPQGQFHYLFWQWGAGRLARRLHRARPFDVAHHVSFVKYWAPSAAAGLGIPFVWGPVGGGEVAPAPFLDAMSAEGARYERSRALAKRLFERLPSVRRTARAATLAFATTAASRERMEALGARAVEVRSPVGLPAEEIARLAALPLPDDGPARFYGIGRQLGWKGYRFAVEAFALAAEAPAFAGAELWLVGDGPEHERLRALAASLGVAGRVRFLGRLSREAMFDRIARAHVLVQTSLHDSGGFVCVESLAAGRPVVGFALGGTVENAPPEAARLVPAETPAAAVRALALEMRALAADPAARRRLGRAGRRIATESFGWPARIAEVADRYWDLVDRPRPAPLAEAPTLAAPPDPAWT